MFGCVLYESCADLTECSRRVAGAIRSLVNARDLQLEFSRVLRETLAVPVLTYGSETILWKERSRIRAVQMNNLRGFLGIRRMDRVTNAWIREVCRVMEECVLQWFGHVERMENDRITKRVYVGE